jgi:hypothetical protein
LSASRLTKTGELVAGWAICLGWVVAVHWVCGGDPGGYLAWFDSVAGLALAGVFEAVTLESVFAAIVLWVCWAVFVVSNFSPLTDNAGAFFLVIGLPALGVVFGLIFRKRPARALR